MSHAAGLPVRLNNAHRTDRAALSAVSVQRKHEQSLKLEQTWNDSIVPNAGARSTASLELAHLGKRQIADTAVQRLYSYFHISLFTERSVTAWQNDRQGSPRQSIRARATRLQLKTHYLLDSC